MSCGLLFSEFVFYPLPFHEETNTMEREFQRLVFWSSGRIASYVSSCVVNLVAADYLSRALRTSGEDIRRGKDPSDDRAELAAGRRPIQGGPRLSMLEEVLLRAVPSLKHVSYVNTWS